MTDAGGVGSDRRADGEAKLGSDTERWSLVAPLVEVGVDVVVDDADDDVGRPPPAPAGGRLRAAAASRAATSFIVSSGLDGGLAGAGFLATPTPAAMATLAAAAAAA